jgi:RNA polymerase sigma-70 factor (ECF subfamily)
LTKNSNSDDLSIVEKLKNGNNAEFRLLVEKYKDVSFSLAYSILKDEHIAEDALQEAFLKVFKNIRQFRNQSLFSTWLYRIVTTTCLKIAKKNKRARLHDSFDTDIHGDTTNNMTGFDNVIASERKEVIHSAVRMMKSNEAMLLQLYYLSELSIEEIKEITGFKESKIKVTLYRGRTSFQENLQKILGNEIHHFIS